MHHVGSGVEEGVFVAQSQQVMCKLVIEVTLLGSSQDVSGQQSFTIEADEVLDGSMVL